jgi:aminopeptidase N
VVNAGGHGFFRVGYSATLRDRLTAVLASLGSLERYNLVDDAWQEVVAGRLAAIDYLSFLEGFRAERELAVWQAIVRGLRGLGRLLGDDTYPRFQARVHALLAPAVAELGDPVAGEDDVRGKLRGLLFAAFAIQGGDDATVARARELFDRAEADPASVHPELVAAATSVVANKGDAAAYERMLAAYHAAGNPQEQLRHLNALAEFDDEALILRTCELAMTPDVKTQNAPFLLARCIGNRRHGAAAWTFVRQHWAAANEAFPRNTIVRMVSSVSSLTDEAVAADVQSFFAEHPIEQAAKTLEQVLERQRVNTALRAREEGPFAAGL